jgi:NAD(P)-dependent dehydrogenase (short-subunit alcohol dehydrogenase family)
MNRLKDKVAIITGAAGGMGKAEALLFAQEGASVLVTDLQFEKMDKWVMEAQAEKLSIECARHDVTSESDWKTVCERALELYGKIDILVNNAGVFPATKTCETTDKADWDKVIAINLTGPFLGARAVIPHMKKNKHGVIINVSSIAGLVGGNGPAYTASKGGLRMLTKDLAIEFAKENIRVNSLHPGGVLTPMTEELVKGDGMKDWVKTMCPQGRMADPIELAYAALFLASPESSFMTGAEMVVDGGLVAR